MKVLHVNIQGNLQGGTQLRMREVCDGLEDFGHQNVIMYSTNEPNEDDYNRRRFYRIPSLDKYKVAKTSILDDFADIIQKEEPDIIFYHNIANIDIIALSIELKPSIRHFHDYESICLLNPRIYPISRRICHGKVGLRCLLHGCFIGRAKPGRVIPTYKSLRSQLEEIKINKKFQKIIVDSKYMKKALTTNGFDETKVSILPPFVETPAITCDSVKNSNKTVLFVGQIEYIKGIFILLKAIKYMNPTFTIKIVGDGRHLEKAKNYAKKMKLRNIEFVGWIPHEKVHQYYLEASVVVVPSIWAEPYGLVGLEAMAHAKPVVAFNVGGIPDWLEDGKTGLLVDRIDKVALAKTIEKVLNDEHLRINLGYNARCVAEKKSKDDYIKKLLHIFQDTIDVWSKQQHVCSLG